MKTIYELYFFRQDMQMRFLKKLYYKIKAFIIFRIKEPLMFRFVCKKHGHLFVDKRDWCSRCSEINKESLRNIIWLFLKDKKEPICSITELKEFAKSREAFYSYEDIIARLVFLYTDKILPLEFYIRLK